MNRAYHRKVATLQHTASDEFLSEPDLLTDSYADSDLESSTGSEYERYCNTIEIDADIANTHKTNEELRGRDAVKQFFKEVENMDTLEDNEKREWIGSLPSKMFEEAIPLFTDFDTRTDYQLHFSYTRMEGLHTYTFPSPVSHHAAENESDDIPDYYVHSLLHATNRNKVELVSEPNIVIPLGKLFVNESGRSNWTGYEVFVSSNMELWMIYILDEDDFEKWYSVDCSLSRRRTIPGSAKEEQTEKFPSFKIARLWNSLRTLHSGSFKEAADTVGASRSNNYTGSFRLLEISTSEISQAISSSNKSVYKILETRGFRVNAESPAGREMLLLAAQNAEKPILKLKFENQAQSEFDDSQPLNYLVTRYGGPINPDPPIVVVMSWTARYTDSCPTHRSEKEGSRWYPKKPRKPQGAFQTPASKSGVVAGKWRDSRSGGD